MEMNQILCSPYWKWDDNVDKSEIGGADSSAGASNDSGWGSIFAYANKNIWKRNS